MIFGNDKVKQQIEDRTGNLQTAPIVLDFVKDPDGSWYAYIPALWDQGMKANCIMVAGAPDILDILAKGDDRITLHITQKYTPDYDMYLVNADDNAQFQGESGGDYLVAGYSDRESNECFGNFKIWLCGVTVFVFGGYPKLMFIKRII